MIVRKSEKTISVLALIILLLILLGPRLYYAVCWQIYLTNPNIVQQKKTAYEQLPSEVLIKKLEPWNIWWFDTALDILAKRRSKEAVPHILSLLKSHSKYRRHSAIRALGDIGDERAGEPLMKIIRAGEQHPDYSEALHALSKMKYGPAYTYVVKWAQRNDAPRNGSIYMLEDFERLESIPLLEHIRMQIKKEDPGFEFRADEAIKHIEAVRH